MMHVAPIGGGFAIPMSAPEFARLETLRAQVDAARRAAGESLERLNAHAGPDIGQSGVFGELLEAHDRDKEALFEAMRRLDAVLETLRASGTAP